MSFWGNEAQEFEVVPQIGKDKLVSAENKLQAAMKIIFQYRRDLEMFSRLHASNYAQQRLVEINRDIEELEKL